MLKSIARRIYYHYMQPHIRLSNNSIGLRNLVNLELAEHNVVEAIRLASISNVRGDYVEFGSWKGRSLLTAYYESKRHPVLKDMKFFAFDSFQGLSQPNNEEMNFSQFRKGDYECGFEQFKNIIIGSLKKSGNSADISRFHFTKGWFEDTLNRETKKKISLKKASVVLIDCDLYDPAKLALNFVTDYIEDGTVLLFDDWFAFHGRKDMGERRACVEWLKKNKQFELTEVFISRQGPAFIVNEI